MNPPSESLTLVDLPRIRIARILEVEGNCATCERLRELGFCPGTEVRFVRQAPFGGPMILSLRGYQLVLRPSEARRVCIQGLPSPGEPE